jgi:amino acid permease
MPDAVAEYGGNTNRSLWVGIGWLLMVPLACLRTLDALKFTSTLALMFVGFVTLFVLLYAVGIPTLDPCDGERGEINGTTSCRGAADYATTTGDRTLRVFSIFVFSFTCQQVRKCRHPFTRT